MKYKNTNAKSTGFNKYFARLVYEGKHITTKEICDFIQQQASVKRSDCKAVLDELGSAIQHFIGLGHKVRIENVGIFKCGVRNVKGGFSDSTKLTASTLTPKILFLPEYTTQKLNGITRGVCAMTSEITFEEYKDYTSPDPKPTGGDDSNG